MRCPIAYHQGGLMLGPCSAEVFEAAMVEARATPNGRGLYQANLDHLSDVLASLKSRSIGASPSKSLHLALYARAEELERWKSQEEWIVRTQGLYPYQAEGVGWLRGKRRALLADDMGLGKTVQACQVMSHHEATLVVCPKVMIGTWVQEVKRWRPELSPIALPEPEAIPAPGCVTVLNYEQLYKDGMPAEYSCIIADEAHYLKNPQAGRTQRFRAIADKADRVYGLTGTPLLNSPGDLWGVLDALGMAKEAYGSEANYNKAFGRSSDRHGKTIWGKPTPAIAAGLSRVALRRTKGEVLPQLPTKRFRTIECETMVPGQSGGDDAIPTTLEELQDLEGEEHISTLRKLLAIQKIPKCIELVEQYEQAGEPVVVMSAHVDPVKQLGLRDGWAVICGETPKAERDSAVGRFQAGELRGLACTISAAGIGITLTKACQMVMIDRAWNPSTNWQAEDRICRIGQTRGCVYTFLVSDHPLDMAVHRVIERKRVTIEETVDKMVRPNGLALRLRELADMAKETTS